MKQPIHILWFKRDLRLHDHAALQNAIEAAQRDGGSLLPLYILEPALWQQPDMSARHYDFLCECLQELNHELTALGAPLTLISMEATDAFKHLTQQYDVRSVHAHQESWNGWTYQRDIAVEKWLNERDILWHQPAQHGVKRGPHDRDGWGRDWYRFMKLPQLSVPHTCHSRAGGNLVQGMLPIDSRLRGNDSITLPSADSLGIKKTPCPQRQHGGRQAALRELHSFLHERAEPYRTAMSSPGPAMQHCSRLSPYIAFGCVSMREVFQACETRIDEVKMQTRGGKTKWLASLNSFSKRLRWHCHFIQKLEDEPNIEFAPFHSLYDGVRSEFNEDYFNAWKAGKTGYPLVDACMRSLAATGWLTFRMRAMVMSFASYHLWLDWRPTALHLAQQFTDYEPGIHYSQSQMQSGTTGINAMRIYNPIKQSMDQDPEGEFIKEWIPELREVPHHLIHTPWDAPHLLNGYPMPIVEEKTARKAASDKLYALRRNPHHRSEAQAVFQKHGNRKRPSQRGPRKKSATTDTAQGSLF